MEMIEERRHFRARGWWYVTETGGGGLGGGGEFGLRTRDKTGRENQRDVWPKMKLTDRTEWKFAIEFLTF